MECQENSLWKILLFRGHIAGWKMKYWLLKAYFIVLCRSNNSVFWCIRSFAWGIPVPLPFPSEAWIVVQFHGFWAVVLTGVKAFPSWTMYPQYTSILPKGKTDEVSPRKHIFHFKWMTSEWKPQYSWYLYEEDLVYFFSPGSASTLISPLFSCAFDIPFYILPWIDSDKIFCVTSACKQIIFP